MLAISFDVNRTILIADKAAGKEPIDEVYAILSASMWGSVVEGKFLLDESVPVGVKACSDQLSLYMYLQDNVYPLPERVEGESPDVHAVRVNLRKHEIRDYLKEYFENIKDEKILNVLDELKGCIDLPEGFQLLPSFYHFVCEYGMTETVNIVFRTFGNDMPELIEEFNKFCEGKHPNFPVLFNGENGTRDLRVYKDNVFSFYRNGGESENCFLNLGTYERPDHIAEYNYDPEKTIQGFNVIDDFLQEKFKTGATLAVRDYYYWWASCNEKYDSGKLLLIDSSDKNRVQQIFFDDNIRMENLLSERQNMIVDVREKSTGESHPDVPSLIGDILFHSDAFYAMQDIDYFSSTIKTVLQKISDKPF